MYNLGMIYHAGVIGGSGRERFQNDQLKSATLTCPIQSATLKLPPFFLDLSDLLGSQFWTFSVSRAILKKTLIFFQTKLCFFFDQ